MSVAEHGTIVVANRGNLTPTAAANQLVLRGLSDLTRSKCAGEILAIPPPALRLQIPVGGRLSVRAASCGCPVDYETPGWIEIDSKTLNDVQESLVKLHEDLLVQCRKRWEKLRSLSAPAVIMDNEMQAVHRREEWLTAAKALTNSPDDYSFGFTKDHRGIEKDQRYSQNVEIDQFVIALLSLKHVESLDLYSSSVTDRALVHLRGHTGLTVLSLNSCLDITDDGLRHLSGLTNLVDLELAGCSITDRVLSRLSSLSQLDTLDLSGCPITSNGLTHLRGLTNLRILKIGKHNVFDGGGRCEANITDDGLSCLSGLTNLKELNLRECALTDVGLPYLSLLIRLEELDLAECSLTDRGLAHLAKLTKLKRLFLSGCPLTDKGLANLLNHPELQVLHLGSKDITDAGLAYVAGLTQLQELSLYDCSLTDTGLRYLYGLRNLRNIGGLSQCKQITLAGLTALRSALTNCSID
jgi:Leucine-rich repeat (LRR) protein